jgi:8-amino-7-oxononanoate synthase
VGPLLDELAARLARLEAEGLRRELRDPTGVDFSSNDYLGLSRHPLLRERLRAALADGPLGAPASRLLHSLPCHRELEERLAAWKGTEAALLFPSGYQANLAVLTALVAPGDAAASDALNHASLIDGLRLSGCEKTVFPHLDAAAAEAALARRPRGARAFLVTESLFSMDGDTAPLDRYRSISERHGAGLIIDDAHATGLHGPRGSGLAAASGVAGGALAIVSTFGKALGLAGAFVAGPRVVIDYLVNRARPFLFTTAPPPILVAAAGILLDLAQAEPERRERVLGLAARLRAALAARGIGVPRGEGPIVPVLLGGNDRALRVAEEVRRQGYDVRAIRPPSVPPGTARLRISVHADHGEGEIDGLAAAVAAAVALHPASATGSEGEPVSSHPR